ncbi:MAG: hypothetical protein LQ340_004758 [Diploschistes diacapsis]|nr:MAG: hypothetical protein LQ340_004758 [Diploschistes diacapsis]
MSSTSPSRATKRARPDHSASASPAREAFVSKGEADLPAFLRQSKAEINAKFEELNLQQLLRLGEARAETDQESRWAVDNSPGNRPRNRYGDIRPWEKQRIKLQVPEGASDYINASPITIISTSNGGERKYIATQGPKQTGVDHFWQMVWQEVESPGVIVMLTQLAEGFREKCYQYFPEDTEGEGLLLNYIDAEGTAHHGTLRVVENTYDEESKTTVRKLALTYDTTTKTIHHLLFLAWPDHGVPENSDRAALLSLIKLSRDKNSGWTNPPVIHCSAGVGRSGTFIALEHLLEEIEGGLLDNASALAADEDPIFDTVSALREQRMMMVQSDMQFAFLYDILADACRERRRRRKSGGSHDHDQASTLEKVTSATAKLTALGEPSPKAVRLSTRGLRRIYQDIRSRSLSRRRSEEGGTERAARAGSAPAGGGESEGEKNGAPLVVVAGEGQNGTKEGGDGEAQS